MYKFPRCHAIISPSCSKLREPNSVTGKALRTAEQGYNQSPSRMTSHCPRVHNSRTSIYSRKKGTSTFLLGELCFLRPYLVSHWMKEVLFLLIDLSGLIINVLISIFFNFVKNWGSPLQFGWSKISTISCTAFWNFSSPWGCFKDNLRKTWLDLPAQCF